MKPPPFDYVVASSVTEAAEALAADPDAKALAGGQSLLPMLSFRLVRPSTLVDLARIDGLAAIETTATGIRIGATARQLAVERDPRLARSCPLLVAALHHVSHPQIRSRATIGGSLAHADPAAELPAVAVALDARLTLCGAAGERVVDAEAFVQGIFTTALEPGELLTAIELPAAAESTGVACVEIARRSGDYAICGVVVQVTLEDGVVDDCRIALFGVGERPVRARGVEAAVRGAAPTAASLREAGALAREEAISPFDDVHGSAVYRREAVASVTERALAQAIGRAA